MHKIEIIEGTASRIENYLKSLHKDGYYTKIMGFTPTGEKDSRQFVVYAIVLEYYKPQPATSAETSNKKEAKDASK